MPYVCSKFSAPARWSITVIATGGTVFASNENEITGLLALFPDDDPSHLFNPSQCNCSLSPKSAVAHSVPLVGIVRREASVKRLLHKRSPWEILLTAAQDSLPRYEKYSMQSAPMSIAFNPLF